MNGRQALQLVVNQFVTTGNWETHLGVEHLNPTVPASDLDKFWFQWKIV